ncbi:MAG: DUF4339 domain-containing protein [Candidatus Hydrogenedentota bacterium]|nr:MAG: DUF4339 domain-containing protein [Candidatus Hydrogenedentota bacterium]
MQWYLYRNGETLGPYDKESLRGSIQPEDLVTPVGGTEWVKAEDDAELKDLFSTEAPSPAAHAAGTVTDLQEVTGKSQPDLGIEWYIQRRPKPEQGPFALQALLRMLDRKEIKPTDLLRHQTWPKAVPFSSTRLFKAWKNPAEDPRQVPREDLVEFPESTVSERTGAEPKKAEREKSQTEEKDGRKGWRKKIPRPLAADWEWTPRNIAIIVVIALLPVAGVLIRNNLYYGSDLEFRMKYGTCSADCRSDEASRKICTTKPRKCCCPPNNKGLCGMRGCEILGKMIKSGHAKPIKE